MQGDDKSIPCRDECGARVPDVAAAEAAGWQRLEFAHGWRCKECRLALERVNHLRPTE